MIEKVSTQNAPAALGPYSQAVKVNNFVFCSGQIGIDPATGKMAEGGTIEQFKQVLSNVEAVLTEAGCTFADVVKTTVFLLNMGDFADMNALYGEKFSGEVKPARSAVEVSKLPAGALVEMEVIAISKA